MFPLDKPNGVIYCKDVAIKLGIKGHACKRKYFLDRKNRQRHKLRSFCLAVPEQRQYIHHAFSLNPTISRSTRTPIDQRIEQLMGGVKFEICDNLRHKINSLVCEQAVPTMTSNNSTSGAVTFNGNVDLCSPTSSTISSISLAPTKKQKTSYTEDCNSTICTIISDNNAEEMFSLAEDEGDNVTC